MIDCFDDNLTFAHKPAGTDIPIGSTILPFQHQAVSCQTDLYQTYLFERRTWLQLRDPSSNTCNFSADSHRIFDHVCSLALISFFDPVCTTQNILDGWGCSCCYDIHTHLSDWRNIGTDCNFVHFQPQLNWIQFPLENPVLDRQYGGRGREHQTFLNHHSFDSIFGAMDTIMHNLWYGIRSILHSGDHTADADSLSRWDFVTEPPFNHAFRSRFPISLNQL